MWSVCMLDTTCMSCALMTKTKLRYCVGVTRARQAALWGHSRYPALMNEYFWVATNAGPLYSTGTVQWWCGPLSHYVVHFCFCFHPSSTCVGIMFWYGLSVCACVHVCMHLCVCACPGCSDIWYNMTRDAILTCNQKLTWISLICHTEPTTKKWKNRKTKMLKRICSEVLVDSPGNPWSQSWRRKGRLWWEGFVEKEGLSLKCKSERVTEY